MMKIRTDMDEVKLCKLCLDLIHGGTRLDDESISKALEYGAEQAQALKTGGSRNFTAADILSLMGFEIKTRDDDGLIGGVRFRSRYVEGSREVEIWSKALDEMVTQAPLADFNRDKARELVLAHELYHVIEYHLKRRIRLGGELGAVINGPGFLKRPQFKKNPGGNQMILEEFAASAFARTLIDLEFSPLIFDLPEPV